MDKFIKLRDCLACLKTIATTDKEQKSEFISCLKYFRNIFTSEELENIYHTMKTDATWQAFRGSMSKNLKENYVIDVPDDLSSSVEQTSYEMCFINFFFSFCFEQGETPPRDASIASHSEKMDSTTSTTSTFFSSSGTAEAAIRNEDPPRESVSERGRATYNRWVHQFQAANCEQSDYMYDGQVLPIENLIIPKQKSSGSHTTTTISGSSNIFANAGDFTIPIQMKRKRTQESTDEGPSNKKKHAPTRMAALTWDSSWDETTPILESFVF